MMRRLMWHICALTALIWLSAVPLSQAQRRVTPVQPAGSGLQGVNELKANGDSIDVSKLVETHDDKGNVVLVDTITGKEMTDSVAKMNKPEGRVPKMQQPLLHSVSVSVDFWDPVMRLFGQKYGLVEFAAHLNLHNRYIPVVEVGLGTTDYTPEDNNYTYKVPVTPYFRIGADYNFLYNSNPDYLVTAGLRLGYSHFNYEVNDVTLNSGYWDETATFNLPRQSCSFTYLQVLFGLRVKIAGPVSMGWNFRYKAKLHESKAAYGKPWYIPGFGSRGSAVTGSFYVAYVLPLHKKELDPATEANTAQ